MSVDLTKGATVELVKTLSDDLRTKVEGGTPEEGVSAGDILRKKADNDGYYEEMTVGDAEQLVSSQYVTDSVPYLYRTTGGSADVGNREYKESIVGGSIAWNQEIGTGSSYFANNRSTAVWNGTKVVWTSTESGLFGGYILQSKRATVAGHKYYATALVNISDAGQVKLGFNDTPAQTITPNTNVVMGEIIPSVANNEAFVLYRYGNTDTTGQTLTADNIMLIDLTQMFGSTIADYIYGLETATAGAGVAWFKKYFPLDYYEYDAGTLKHVEGLISHATKGFNQWDEEWEVGGISNSGANYPNTDRIRSKNYIPVIAGATYYFWIGTPAYGIWLWGYDADKNYVGRLPTNGYAIRNQTITMPDNVRYIRFVMQQGYGLTYNHDICINISSDRNGEYEPYVKHSYPLDSSLTLRGVPKLDSANNLYYDGDTYESDGTVTRKYGVITYDGSTDEAWRIHSAGGTLFYIENSNLKKGTDYSGEIICDKLKTTQSHGYVTDDYIITGYNDKNNQYLGQNWIYARANSSITEISAFKTWLQANPITLVYELATPTTEEAEPFQEVQICDDFGTEEFVTTSIVPVGHNTNYPANLRDKLQHLPNLADDGDGYYMIKQVDKQMSLEHFRIPKAPETDGTYTLKATVSGGTPTYTWESEAVENG